MSSRSALLQLINDCKNVRELKQIHTQLVKSLSITESDRGFLVNRLLFVGALSSLQSLTYAANVFNSIKNPNLSAYNIMIRAFASKHGSDDGEDQSLGLGLYKRMLFEGIAPDCLTFPFLLKERANVSDTSRGRIVHGHVVKFGLDKDIFVNNNMISMYSSHGAFVDCARKVFDAMPERDVVSWNSVIVGYLRAGDLDSASELFGRMKGRNIITWNSIITGFVQGGRPREALQLFQEMQTTGYEAVKPDKITMASILTACASLGALDHGKWVHNFLRKTGIECDLVIGTALIDMYGKCGSVDRAVEIFRAMPVRDNLAWTAMISVFALHGLCEEAFRFFEEMQALGLKPNHVTFVGLLTACAHSGSVERGRWCFDAMRCIYKIKREVRHYACMVDLLSRAGLFKEAEGLIGTMPVEPDVFVWGALLGGCLVHGNVDVGERVAKHLIKIEPANHVFYANLCDLYARAGRIGDVKRIRALMRARGIQKEVPGCSMIEIDGIVREFSVRGSAKSMIMEELFWFLNRLGDEMKIGENTHAFL
ncbi:pentatricopeptide repeat-containing protein At5g66520-like [Punica granatum]|uniref:Pentatricopeptide repeat-containing protein At5g66520-like n=1 Tax=Punica granatum TaxID=22663 RepID=A0A6P8DDE3_PUNGR|nr:pentatricopeptide repeat-containing protein At5g66520-like [Punica granatum]